MKPRITEKTIAQDVVLTGIKPTGQPHLGNYFGTIQPALDLASNRAAFYFLADYHALTTVKDARRLDDLVHEVAATWLALGLNPERVVFYRQSAVAEIFELMWILSCVAAKGLLNRAHAYKAAMEANLAAGRDADADINAGLYNYPLLMAADILAFDTSLVPVGRDQEQHVEIARDVAASFNHTFGPVFRLPRAMIRSEVQTIPGLDGRKMSKSYGNVIPIMAAPAELSRAVMRIVTDSRRPEEPKDPETCNVFGLYRHVAPPEEVARVRARYLQGGVAYKDIKEKLASLLEEKFRPARRRYLELIADRPLLDRILRRGALAARDQAALTVSRARKATGIGHT